MKKCNGKCGIEKDDDQFSLGELTKNWGRCRECVSTSNKQYKEERKEEIAIQRKEYRLLNKEKIALEKKNDYEANPEKHKTRHKRWYLKNRDKVAAYWQEYYHANKDILISNAAQWRQNNIEIARERVNKYVMTRYKTDPMFKLRRSISTTINKMLNSNGETKRGASIAQYLDWGIEDLFLHLESLFSHPDNLTSDGKIWMTWENRGVYDPKTWNDNDPGTWTWQLDHIVPQSLTPYASMTDDNFRKTWALPNLRPLSAKQNVLDGNRRGDE
jgi:hypothetical protein